MLEYEEFVDSMKKMNSDDNVKKVLYDLHWHIYKIKYRLEGIEESLKEIHDKLSKHTTAS